MSFRGLYCTTQLGAAFFFEVNPATELGTYLYRQSSEAPFAIVGRTTMEDYYLNFSLGDGTRTGVDTLIIATWEFMFRLFSNPDPKRSEWKQRAFINGEAATELVDYRLVIKGGTVVNVII